ncbi:MAG TPA: extracellular solute-binding protein [Bacillota bacterium]
MARRGWMGFVLIGLILSLFSFNLTMAAPKETKLTCIYATGDPLTKQLVHETIVKFMQRNPGIKISEDLSINTGAYADALKIKDSVGEFPDFVEMRDAPMFVRAEKLAPLPKELMGLYETTIPIYGTVYTAPFMAAAPNGVYYNKTFFKKNGLKEPKTYAEFLQLCEKIKAKGVSPLVAGIKDIWHMGFLFGQFWVTDIASKNPNWIADRYAGKVHFTDADFADAMKQLVTLFTKGYVEPGYMSTTEAQCPSILVSGKVAMYYCGPHVIKQITDADPSFDLGWFPIPDAKGKVYLLGGATKDGWAISAQAAKDPAKVQAFVKFVKFFMAKPQYSKFVASGNYFPTSKQAITYKATPAMQSVLKAYAKAGKSLNWNQGVGANEIPPAFRNWTYKKVQEMLIGTVSVEDGLKQMDEEFDKEARDFNPTKFVPEKLSVPTATK